MERFGPSPLLEGYGLVAMAFKPQTKEVSAMSTAPKLALDLTHAYALEPGDVVVANPQAHVQHAGLVLNVDRLGEDRVSITLLDSQLFEMSRGEVNAVTLDYDGLDTLAKVIPAP